MKGRVVWVDYSRKVEAIERAYVPSSLQKPNALTVVVTFVSRRGLCEVDLKSSALKTDRNYTYYDIHSIHYLSVTCGSLSPASKSFSYLITPTASRLS